MVATMTHETKPTTSQRPQSEYTQPEYERCEICGAPIARGKMPPGPYEPVFIMCHHKVRQGGRDVRCSHQNRFPRS